MPVWRLQVTSVKVVEPPPEQLVSVCYDVGGSLSARGGLRGELVMEEFLWSGAVLGALFGVLHAAQVYRRRMADEGASPGRAAYFALWTVALWTLFGAYLLAFWIIGAVGLAISRLRGPAEAGR